MKTRTAVSLGIASGTIGVCQSSNVIERGNDFLRRLEDVNNYGGQSAGQSVQFASCGRLKVEEENGDGDDDGVSYFYNGRYHSQYYSYAAFHLCESGCGSCDGYTYVTDLADFVEMNIEHVETYCGSCAQQCRRRLEDEVEDEDADANEDAGNYNVDVDCSTCQKQCKSLDGGAMSDEVNYLECQEAYEDQNEGVQVYSGLTCSEGSLIIGTFYDDECTIKHSSEGYGDFTYASFQTVQSFCYSDDYANSGAIYPNVMTCNGASVVNDGGRDDSRKLCKIFKESELTTFQRKTNWHLGLILFILLSLTFCCTCGSYIYYVRHREKTGLAAMDYDVTSDADKGKPAVLT
uniref:Uncharacterized protein n=1 Tax=Helicotheca tamesis TaxID=374047 RepID=A0A7S2I5L7_9STRA